MAARVLCSARSCSSGQLRLSVELQHCEGEFPKRRLLFPKQPTMVVTVVFF